MEPYRTMEQNLMPPKLTYRQKLVLSGKPHQMALFYLLTIVCSPVGQMIGAIGIFWIPIIIGAIFHHGEAMAIIMMCVLASGFTGTLCAFYALDKRDNVLKELNDKFSKE